MQIVLTDGTELTNTQGVVDTFSMPMHGTPGAQPAQDSSSQPPAHPYPHLHLRRDPCCLCVKEDVADCACLTICLQSPVTKSMLVPGQNPLLGKDGSLCRLQCRGWSRVATYSMNPVGNTSRGARPTRFVLCIGTHAVGGVRFLLAVIL